MPRVYFFYHRNCCNSKGGLIRNWSTTNFREILELAQVRWRMQTAQQYLTEASDRLVEKMGCPCTRGRLVPSNAPREPHSEAEPASGAENTRLLQTWNLQAQRMGFLFQILCSCGVASDPRASSSRIEAHQTAQIFLEDLDDVLLAIQTMFHWKRPLRFSLSWKPANLFSLFELLQLFFLRFEENLKCSTCCNVAFFRTLFVKHYIFLCDLLM